LLVYKATIVYVEVSADESVGGGCQKFEIFFSVGGAAAVFISYRWRGSSKVYE
jgi:hypothetical protein